MSVVLLALAVWLIVAVLLSVLAGMAIAQAERDAQRQRLAARPGDATDRDGAR